jgi:sugar lactone lactonase YvrE
VSDFVAPGQPGAWGYYGLAIDPPRGLLWASTAAGAEFDGFQPADSGRTALLAFRLADGALVRRIELLRLPTRQVLGDLTVGPDGTVCAGESVGGMVYRLRPGSDSLEAIVPPGTLRSPQQPAFAADGKRIYVADYSRGIAVIDPATRAVRWLPKPYALASVGLDGLCRNGNKLIAVQNGLAPHRVLELTLDPRGDAITAWHVLEQASPRMGEPNHGVVAGDAYWFIGDSGWDRVGDDDRLVTPATARAPVLLRMPLK